MNNDVYNIFKLYDNLYKDFKELKEKKNDMEGGVSSCVNIYEEIINNNRKGDYSSIQEEMDKFRDHFHIYLKGISTYKCKPGLLNSSLMIPPKNITKAEAISGDTASSVMWTSTGLLFFAILIIIFIVYNVNNKFI
ncbi:hypothetical protein PGO_002160 [Plasmodium gonderi]|uniref:Variable surface protein n=1 Tax=Plasmodium gonderi TaxID=77519 RepID=A0A1Y1JV71_PLAGO|nr:hypothetical protein PGO_002160 [Plasmodium gonderi]GAW84293.1 hypothetical protein PGO_002160 [Plasmodium gonderi]